MKPRISNRNIQFYLRQELGIKSTQTLFKDHANTKFCENVIKKVVQEFTGYAFQEGRLATYNPYTNKHESLNITSLAHVDSKEALFKELSMLHKARMKMLEQSRKKIIQLSKKKYRDHDLEAESKRLSQRQSQLSQGKDLSNDKELER